MGYWNVGKLENKTALLFFSPIIPIFHSLLLALAPEFLFTLVPWWLTKYSAHIKPVLTAVHNLEYYTYKF